MGATLYSWNEMKVFSGKIARRPAAATAAAAAAGVLLTPNADSWLARTGIFIHTDTHTRVYRISRYLPHFILYIHHMKRMRKLCTELLTGVG